MATAWTDLQDKRSKMATASTSSSAFLNLNNTSLFPIPRYHFPWPRTTPFLSSLPLSLSSSRRRLTLTPILSTLKEEFRMVTKVWSDFTSLNYWVIRDYYRLVNFVNSLEPHIQKLSDKQVCFWAWIYSYAGFCLWAIVGLWILTFGFIGF